MTGGTANTEDPGGRWRQPMSGFVSVLPKIPVLARDRVATSEELWSRTDMKGPDACSSARLKVIAMLKKRHPVLVAAILPARRTHRMPRRRPGPGAARGRGRRVTVKPRPVTITTELPGEPPRSASRRLRTQVSGVLLKRLFVEGNEVKAGQPLYQIDPAPFQASYDSAKATLEHAQAELTTAKLLEERYRPLVEVKRREPTAV